MPTMPDEIIIYCNSSKGHSKKRREAVVMVFQFHDHFQADQPRWEVYVKSARLRGSEAAWKTTDTLANEKRFDSRTMTSDDIKGADIRFSWKLECPFCKVNVSIREEKLFNALDTLREYGVARIELGALAATMANMTSK